MVLPSAARPDLRFGHRPAPPHVLVPHHRHPHLILLVFLVEGAPLPCPFLATAGEGCLVNGVVFCHSAPSLLGESPLSRLAGRGRERGRHFAHRFHGCRTQATERT